MSRSVSAGAVPAGDRALGAAAAAARGVGLWSDYGGIGKLHQLECRCVPNPENAPQYRRMIKSFHFASEMLSDFGDFEYGVNDQ